MKTTKTVMAGVPRWADRLARWVPLMTLPSGLWRVALVAGLPIGAVSAGTMPLWEKGYVLSLSVVSELLALLTLGLVQPWGERVPRWVPLLGGRRIPRMAAVVPAVLGGLALTLIWEFYAMGVLFLEGGFDNAGFTIAGNVLLVVCYAPLLAWGPALLAVTWAYYQRRGLRQPVAG
ncbi:hypothetical protein [Longispora albida]|uniref:hypothetical protein n=1 Tax=Longispora albida TaxID=203523 RepID=UPI0003780CEE|nr:hypothetical protein [Longispora albida]